MKFLVPGATGISYEYLLEHYGLTT